MILITGATGQLGTIVIENLLKKTSADQIAGLARDEAKAATLKERGVDIRIGHYDDTDSLKSAMQGIEKVLLIAGTDEQRRVQQHQNVVDAAKKAGVQCVAYTSRSLKDRNTLVNQLMLGHFQTEDIIKTSGLNYTIFRNVLYMDAIPQFVGEHVLSTGISLPAGEGKLPFALRSEMGEGIANALVTSDCNNRIYTFTGSKSYSFADIASTLTNLSGKTVTYTPVEKSAFEAQLKARGLPEVVAQRISGFMTDIKNGQEDQMTSDLEQMLGRKPATLEEGLKVMFKFV
jgi:NAD(P)H dehydrogenase (quinone)